MSEKQRIEQTLYNGSVLVVEVTEHFLSWEVWCSERKCQVGECILTLDEAVGMVKP
jgi:hypothetical protein